MCISVLMCDNVEEQVYEIAQKRFEAYSTSSAIVKELVGQNVERLVHFVIGLAAKNHWLESGEVGVQSAFERDGHRVQRAERRRGRRLVLMERRASARAARRVRHCGRRTRAARAARTGTRLVVRGTRALACASVRNEQHIVRVACAARGAGEAAAAVERHAASVAAGGRGTHLVGRRAVRGVRKATDGRELTRVPRIVRVAVPTDVHQWNAGRRVAETIPIRSHHSAVRSNVPISDTHHLELSIQPCN